MWGLQGVVTKIDNFEGTQQERQRAIWVLVFLQTGSVSKAGKTSGLKGKAHKRIIQMFKDRGSILEHARSGRPVKYTPTLMETAYDILISNEDKRFTGTQLKRLMIEEGLIDSKSDIGVFMQHLRQYVQSQGHRLITNSTKTTFFLSVGDLTQRLSFAYKLKAQALRQTMDMFIFVDETTLEEGPHPKGI